MGETSIVLALSAQAAQSIALRIATIFLAVRLPVIVSAAALAFLAVRMRSIRGWIALAGTLLLSRGFFTEAIRFLWDRPRPFEALGFDPLAPHGGGGAFPSGHAAFLFAFAFGCWVVRKDFRVPGPLSAFPALALFAAAALNGIARVAAGLHWPTDILGGAAVAAASAALVVWGERRFGRRFRRVVS